jgi:hypothetical protein
MIYHFKLYAAIHIEQYCRLFKDAVRNSHYIVATVWRLNGNGNKGDCTLRIFTIIKIIITICNLRGQAVVQLVEALGHKTRGPGFNSR